MPPTRPTTIYGVCQALFAWQIVRFGLVSVIGLLTDNLVLFASNGLLGVRFLGLSVALGYLVGSVLHFFIARRLVFTPSHYHPSIELTLVTVVGLVGLGLTEVIVLLLHARFHYSVLLAKTIAIVIVFFWNYLGRRWLVYHQPRKGTAVTAAQVVK